MKMSETKYNTLMKLRPLATCLRNSNYKATDMYTLYNTDKLKYNLWVKDFSKICKSTCYHALLIL